MTTLIPVQEAPRDQFYSYSLQYLGPKVWKGLERKVAGAEFFLTSLTDPQGGQDHD